MTVLIAAGALTLSCDQTDTEPSPPPCAYALSVPSLTFDAPGGERSVSVATEARCAWSATTLTPWLAVASGVARMGNGTVTITATGNGDTTSRTGVVNVATHSVQVLQEGQPLAPCVYQLEPDAASIEAGGATGSFAVRTQLHCPWTATSTEPWLRITSGSAGEGDGTVHYVVDPNPRATPQEASVQVAGRTFLLTQAGEASACTYGVSPVTFTPCMSAIGELASAVTTQDGCRWTASSDASWMTITQGDEGTGSGDVRFTVADNYDRPRTGVVRVRWPTATLGQNVQIQQAGCTYWVSQSAYSLGPAATSAAFDVLQQSDPIACGGPLQNGCEWTAVSDATWLTITTTMPVRGDGRVTFAIAANAGSASRTATITVRDQVVRVTQSGL